MESSEQGSSGRPTWCRPDSDRFFRSPLATDGQELIVSDLYMADSACKKMLGHCKSESVLYGVMAIIYFVFDPDAPMYKHLDRKSRIERVLGSHVQKSDKKKVEALIKSAQFDEFKSDYLRLVSTPSQLMLRAFTDQVHEFVEQTNHGNQFSGKDLQARIKEGKQLLIDLEDLQAFVQKEGKSKVRGDYRPSLFERRENALSTR